MTLCGASNDAGPIEVFCTREPHEDGDHVATIGGAGGPEIARWPMHGSAPPAAPSVADCNCDQARALQAQLRTWRGWAQFVYGGGGAVTGTDDELRAMVCAKHDAELETVKGGRQRMREVLTASRDVLAAFQKQAGYLPAQQAYSTRMTQGEMDLSGAVAAITNILSEESPALLRETPQPNGEATLPPHVDGCTNCRIVDGAWHPCRKHQPHLITDAGERPQEP
jgi:hypothetical protein